MCPSIALVRDEYDGSRLTALHDDPGLRLVPDSDPEWAVKATREVLAIGPTKPREAWDGHGFADHLSLFLPPAPRLA